MASKKRSKSHEPEMVDDLMEDVTEPTLETVELPLTYLVKDGENILTVAEKFKPADVSRADYAKTLANLNGTVTPGRVVRLG
jgi:hypothetical protein